MLLFSDLIPSNRSWPQRHCNFRLLSVLNATTAAVPPDGHISLSIAAGLVAAAFVHVCCLSCVGITNSQRVLFAASSVYLCCQSLLELVDTFFAWLNGWLALEENNRLVRVLMMKNRGTGGRQLSSPHVWSMSLNGKSNRFIGCRCHWVVMFELFCSRRDWNLKEESPGFSWETLSGRKSWEMGVFLSLTVTWLH